MSFEFSDIYTIVFAISICALLVAYFIEYSISRTPSVGGILNAVNFGFDPIMQILATSGTVVLVALFAIVFNIEIVFQELWSICIVLLSTRIVVMCVADRVTLLANARWLSTNASSLISGSIISLTISKSLSSAPEGLDITVLIIALSVMAFLALKRLPTTTGYEQIYQNYFAISLCKKYVKKYAYLLDRIITNNSMLYRLFFSIMIVEEMNRPSLFRLFERIAFKTGRIHTTGLMQVTNKSVLTNEQSILLAQEIVLDSYSRISQTNTDESEIIKSISYVYNGSSDYSEVVMNTYNAITKSKILNLNQ